MREMNSGDAWENVMKKLPDTDLWERYLKLQSRLNKKVKK